MKKIICTYFLCLAFITVKGQTEPHPYTSGVDAKMQLLDKSYITTDILYDRVYPFAQLRDFNREVADTSNADHFYHAYAELQNADYTGRWNTVNRLTDQVGAQPQNHIPIGIIHVDFEYLDERAIMDNLLDVTETDSLLVDVPGRPRSPYLKKTALVASPLLKETRGKTVTFVTGAAYKMLASTKTISTIAVDFGNGEGYQELPTTGTKTVTFPDIGLYHLKFKIQFTDNDLKYAYAKLRVNPTNPIYTETQLRNATFNCTSGTIISSRKFKGYTETTAYSGTGEYEIRQGGTYFDKPVIVLDGFDPKEGTDDGINLDEIYLEFLRYNGNHNLGVDLRSNGFDIVPLNFTKYEAYDGTIINGGTDYIERNAMVLVELIEQINQCKTGNRPIKIIGFSMGGLVARYALAYMEQENIPHHADLFVSVDTPHKGATVPIGIQETADVLDDVLPFGLGNPADDILHTPAAKQMLIDHYLASSQLPVGAPNFHDRFYNELDAMGFPQQTRNVAVVNGVSDGTPINIPGQNYMDGHINPGDGISTGTDWHATLNYAPDRGQTKRTLDFKIQIKFILFGITIYRRTAWTTTLSAPGSYENSPGGFYEAETLINNFFISDNEFSQPLLQLLEDFVLQIEARGANFSFIPVKSSLAYNGSNPDLYEDFADRDLTCTGETPFNSYFTAKNDNQKHIELTTSSANFIEQEVLGNPQQSTVYLDKTNMHGPSLVCDQDQAFYFIDNCTVSVDWWNVSPNLNVIDSDENSITVEPTDPNAKGAGFVTAHFAHDYARREFWIGEPDIYTLNLDGTKNYMGGGGTYSANSGTKTIQVYSDAPSTSYSWEVSPPNTIGWGYHGGKATFYTSVPGNYLFTVEATNDCGSHLMFFSITIENDSSPNYFAVYPNPTSGSLNIENSAANLNQNNSTYKLYDFNGNPVLMGTFSNLTTLDVSSLLKGHYILKISSANVTRTHHIVVE